MRTTELFIYHPDYLLLPCISTSFHLHRSQDLLVEDLIDVETPSTYGNPLVLYIGFVWPYTYNPFSLIRRLDFSDCN
jgi:hypothetical protein